MTPLYGLIKYAWTEFQDYQDREDRLRVAANQLAKEHDLTLEQKGELMHMVRAEWARKRAAGIDPDPKEEMTVGFFLFLVFWVVVIGFYMYVSCSVKVGA
jgi:hypothetical protein